MKKQLQNEIYEKIRSILRLKVFDIQRIKLKTFNMRTFLWMSSIYALVWIIIFYSPHELHKLFTSGNLLSCYLKDLLIGTFDHMFCVYLPEIVIFIFDFLANKFKINDKNVIKSIRILLLILSYIYLVVFGILIYVVIMGAIGLFEEP